MANFRGNGALKDVPMEIIVKASSKPLETDRGVIQFIQPLVDMRDPKYAGETNPYLRTDEQRDSKTGEKNLDSEKKPYLTHDVSIDMADFEKIQAADPNPYKDEKGNLHYAIVADARIVPKREVTRGDNTYTAPSFVTVKGSMEALPERDGKKARPAYVFEPKENPHGPITAEYVAQRQEMVVENRKARDAAREAAKADKSAEAAAPEAPSQDEPQVG